MVTPPPILSLWPHHYMKNDPAILTLAAGLEHLPLLTTLAAAFASAWVLGIITHRLGLSPIVGYLLAGVAIGPHTPGFVGDVVIAQQLAEVGVILLMFGVGLHFRLRDLYAVRGVAIPGAIVQSLVATIATVLVFRGFGWSLEAGVVLGMAMAVASTVVLLRVLMDRAMLDTTHGHVAVGWLIVEDIMTVLALVLIPILASEAGNDQAAEGAATVVATIGWAVVKIGALVAIVVLAGSRAVPWILTRIALLRSSELFTLTVLVLSVAIAVGAAALFGASVALGAFLAGMVVSQSPASHQAAADALPMRDAFAVLFFVSVGMLFDPSFLYEQPAMVAAGLVIVMLVKPLAATIIVALRGYPARTALTVAIGLAQIGEFSFILAQVASDHALLPDAGFDVVVATAMISITVNPLLFRSLGWFEQVLERRPWLWRLLNARHARQNERLNAAARDAIKSVTRPFAVIVGYGPVGRLVDALLRDAGIETVIIDLNMETVQTLSRARRMAIYGDATRREVLEQAGLARAAHLVIALPHSEGRTGLVRMAREVNATASLAVRARYIAERESLLQSGASHVVLEEGEAGVALARWVLEQRGLEADRIGDLLKAVRRLWLMGE